MMKLLFLSCLVALTCAQTDCPTYCNLFMTICNDAISDFNWSYDDMTDCLTTCAAFPAGAISDVAVNSVGCRSYHAQAANTSHNTSYHCPHASSVGGALCGSYCESYCNMSLHGCTATNGYAVMGSPALNNYAECMKICAIYPVGEIGLDVDGNTLACRTYHAQNVYKIDDTHCPHASPNGDNVCGTQCEAYCMIYNGSCGAAVSYPFESYSCTEYCIDNWEGSFDGLWNDTTGDSLSCRLYHADAYLALGAPHCSHAGPSGDNTCGIWCDTYCDLIQQNCVLSDSQYNTDADCQTACAAFSTGGSPQDASGNTVQCRIYHAGVAGVTDPTLHCPHAGPTGGGVCVGNAPTTAAAATTAATATTGAAVSIVASFSMIVAVISALLL